MKTMPAAEFNATAAAPKRRKYGNKPVTVDGIRFDSQAEARRWGELVVLQRAGVIAALRRQPRYELHAPDGTLIGHYVGDFEYAEVNGVLAVEDVKSPATAKDKLFVWKRRHLEAEHGLRLRLVGKGISG